MCAHYWLPLFGTPGSAKCKYGVRLRMRGSVGAWHVCVTALLAPWSVRLCCMPRWLTPFFAAATTAAAERSCQWVLARQFLEACSAGASEDCCYIAEDQFRPTSSAPFDSCFCQPSFWQVHGRVSTRL